MVPDGFGETLGIQREAREKVAVFNARFPFDLSQGLDHANSRVLLFHGRSPIVCTMECISFADDYIVLRGGRPSHYISRVDRWLFQSIWKLLQ